MAQMDDRVQLIGSAILSQAQQEARDIIDKANNIRQKEIDNFKDEIVSKMFVKVQERANSIRLGSVKAIAHVELDARRTLLELRTSKTNEVFSNVTNRLRQYSETDGYKTDMLKRAEELKDSYDHGESIVLVRESDLALGGDIVKAIGGKTVQKDASIKIGGFKLLNKKAGVLVDETLDERMEEQRPWFLQNCGLNVI